MWFDRFYGLAAERQKLPQKGQFEHFSLAGCGYGEKFVHKAQVEHFGRLAADFGKSGLRRFSLIILVGWQQMWAKVVSESAV